MMQWLNILVGATLLIFGRRIFWLFVAGVGFLVGTTLATEWLGDHSEMATVLIALGIGVVGAILAVFLQRLVVGVAGFLSGGYLLYTLAFELKYEAFAWIAFLLGGVIGAILVMALFDWALILLSALTGATVIVQNVPLDSLMAALLFVVLLGFGVVVQARGLTRAPPVTKQAAS